MANAFLKLRKLREIVGETYPNISTEELTNIVQFLANNWHGSKKKKGVALTQQQLVIYELLQEHKYNPATVYRWLLLATAPVEIQEKVKFNEISIRDALKQRKKQRKVVAPSDQEFIRAIIRCFEMYVSEPSENYPGKVQP